MQINGKTQEGLALVFLAFVACGFATLLGEERDMLAVEYASCRYQSKFNSQ